MNQKQKNTYWLYGLHTVRAALDNPRRNCRRLLVTKNAGEKLDGTMKKPESVDAKYLEKLLPAGAVHQGVALEVSPLDPLDLEDIMDCGKPLLILDQVTDPHNVGAILRSAAAFDAGAVIMTRDHAPPETAALAKAASGALEIIPLVVVTNLAATLRTLKEHGYWIVGLDGEAPATLSTLDFGASTALVLGAEGRGLRRLTGELCDVLARLPISPHMESLNVSNAAAVALYELQRGKRSV